MSSIETETQRLGRFILHMGIDWMCMARVIVSSTKSATVFPAEGIAILTVAAKIPDGLIKEGRANALILIDMLMQG